MKYQYRVFFRNGDTRLVYATDAYTARQLVTVTTRSGTTLPGYLAVRIP